MADDSKVPSAKEGLATGVQTVGGVPMLAKDKVAESSPTQNADGAKEKERVLATFHSKDPETESEAGGNAGLATGVQSIGGVPVLTKQLASVDKQDDAAVAGKEKERVLAAFHGNKASAENSEAELVAGTEGLAPSVQSVGGVPIVTKQVAGLGTLGDAETGANEKEKVLAAFHSAAGPATVSTSSEKPEPTEPSPKESWKGPVASMQSMVASAFKSKQKPEKEGETGGEEEADGAKLGKLSLRDRVGSFSDKVLSQAASLRSSWSKPGEEKEVQTETTKPESSTVEPKSVSTELEPVKEGREAEAAVPAPNLASPSGGEKTTVKERVVQRMGSLTERMKQQASSFKSVWKPEDKKGAIQEDLERTKPVFSETAPDPAPSYEHGKGQVLVFSISGCPHCKAAKALLKKKGVKFAEVNLDVFPERREEMQERTGKSSCPQIFFNDKLIGGNDALQALENEGKLDAELQIVHETPIPSTAPAPAGPSKATETATVQQPNEHLETVELLREKVTSKDRWFKLRKYERCFVGSEAVDLLATEKELSRQEATSLLQKLQTKHFFHHVLREHPFKDGPFFYRFLEHEPFVKSAANWSGATSDSEPPPAVELGNKLRKMILAVYDEFLSDDGRHVDYQGIAKSEVFRRYVKETLALQRVDVAALSREEKLAFFINIYNALVIHVTVVLGHGPTTLAVRRHFFTEHTYIIGGASYSLTAIENGILRGNKRPPFFFTKPFGEKDDRLPVALTTPEPLIHFALVCGAKSCPPVKTYEPKTVDESLKAAAQGFFEGGGIGLDVESKTIHLSKILSWYKTDFGSTDLEVLKFVARFLTPKERDRLEALISEGKFKIEYQPYDWSPNGNA